MKKLLIILSMLILVSGSTTYADVDFTIDNTLGTVNGIETKMDVPARLIQGKTMIPIRFLSENLGYTVDWIEESNMALIYI